MKSAVYAHVPVCHFFHPAFVCLLTFFLITTRKSARWLATVTNENLKLSVDLINNTVAQSLCPVISVARCLRL